MFIIYKWAMDYSNSQVFFDRKGPQGQSAVIRGELLHTGGLPGKRLPLGVDCPTRWGNLKELEYLMVCIC